VSDCQANAISTCISERRFFISRFRSRNLAIKISLLALARRRDKEKRLTRPASAQGLQPARSPGTGLQVRVSQRPSGRMQSAPACGLGAREMFFGFSSLVGRGAAIVRPIRKVGRRNDRRIMQACDIVMSLICNSLEWKEVLDGL
jgi:hypothetical protein